VATFSLQAKHAELDRANAVLLARLAREVDDETPMRPASGATSGGDEIKLRGLPAIGRGVSGAIRAPGPAIGSASRPA
jgi:hypothetical protein